ncbi:hypothetical protein ACFLWU_00035 [Chloroflexota bacterium]
MKCDRCGEEITEVQVYEYDGKKLCEDCRIHVGLYPLGHTGQQQKAFYIKDRKR